MQYIVREVTVSDASEIARVQMSAFYPDPHFRALWCQGMSLNDKINGISQRQPHALTTSRDLKRHQKVLDLATGEVVGYARWIMPDGAMALWPDAQVAEPSQGDAAANYTMFLKATAETGHALGVNLEMLKETNPALVEAQQQIIGRHPEKHLRLDYIAVMPDHQLRGVASLLLLKGLVVAKGAGLKTFGMATTPAGVGLFKSHGFELVESIVQDESAFGGRKDQTTGFFVL